MQQQLEIKIFLLQYTTLPMTELEKLIKAYQELSFDDKKAKLITILEDLKWTRPIFDEVLDNTKINPRVNDRFLVWCYVDIMTLADKVESLHKSRNVEKLSTSLHDKMKKLHDREDAERAEESPDDMIKNM